MEMKQKIRISYTKHVKAAFLKFAIAAFTLFVLGACEPASSPAVITSKKITEPYQTTTLESLIPLTTAEITTTITSVPATLAPTTTELTTPEPTTVDIHDIEINTPHGPNALSPLKINTYDGYNQPCHPKVLYFENGWNGYEYWMVYTPYPYCEDSLENPSIAVSHNSIDWIVPPGIKNPVTGAPPTLENSAHYSDPHILMNGEIMELWYRYNPSYGDGVNADSNGGVIMRTISWDGVNWSAAETMLPGSKADRNPVLSPVVILKEGLYSMWYAKRDGYLHLVTSNDGVKWSEAQKVNLEVPGYNIWHHDIIETDIGFEAVFCARPKNATNNLKGLELFYAMSYDGINFTTPVKIISPRKDPGAHDNCSIYRASIIKRGGYYLVYYSSMSENYIWKISLSAGPSISSLVGFGREGFTTN